jgi:Membrane domain of glycerophosphoryl diester phosphodiesterase
MNDTTPQPEGTVTLQPMRPGAILSTALELYRRHLLPLIAIVAVIVVPSTILSWRGPSCPGEPCRITVLDGQVVSTSFWATTAWMLALIVLLVVFAALLVVIIRAITAELAGRDPGVWHSYRSGVAGPRSLLQVAILVVGLVAAVFLLNLPGIYLSGFGGPLASLALVANLLLGVVAVLYVGVRLAVSIPAVVVEGRRWRQALSRSWSLTSGHWGHVLATLLLAFLAISLFGTLLRVLSGPLVGDTWLAQTLFQAAVNTLIVSYLLAVWVLLYLDLRARKEHLVLDTLRADLQGPEA